MIITVSCLRKPLPVFILASILLGNYYLISTELLQLQLKPYTLSHLGGHYQLTALSYIHPLLNYRLAIFYYRQANND